MSLAKVGEMAELQDRSGFLPKIKVGLMPNLRKDEYTGYLQLP